MDHERQETQENSQKNPDTQLQTAPTKYSEPEKDRRQEKAENTGWSLDLRLSKSISSAVNLDSANPKKLRKCGICKELFGPSRDRIIYCSDECKKEGHKLKSAAWKARNRHRCRIATKRYYKKHREKILARQKEYFRANKEEISGKLSENRANTPIEERRVKERALMAISEKPFEPYSEEEDAFILDSHNRMTIEEISRFLKRSMDSVRHRLKFLKR